MCRLENRRFRIFIDRDDRLRVIHAGSKLDRTGHAAGDDEFWADRTATQTDLHLASSHPASTIGRVQAS